MQCPDCSTLVPRKARFCPKCGRAASPEPQSQPATPKIKPNVPLSGFLFIAGVVLGPTLIVAGFIWHLPAIIWVGVAFCLLVLLILLVNLVLG